MSSSSTTVTKRKLKLSILVLAAGSSSRFTGTRSKLLAPVGDICLLEKVLRALKPFDSKSIHLVINPHSPDIEKIASNYHYVINTEAKRGLSSSLRAGIEYIQQQSPSTDAVLIILGDQPAISSSDLTSLINNFYLACETKEKKAGAEKNKPQPILAVAAIYGSPPAPGVPALLEKQLFNQLCTLKGDQGAKPLLAELQKQQSLIGIPMPNAIVDIDTQEDLSQFCSEVCQSTI